MPFSIPGTAAPSMAAHTGVKGADFSNPAADKLNKKRKKYQTNPSLAGLKVASSNASKPFLSEGPPVAGPVR